MQPWYKYESASGPRAWWFGFEQDMKLSAYRYR